MGAVALFRRRVRQTHWPVQGPFLDQKHAAERNGDKNCAGDKYQTKPWRKVGMTGRQLFQRNDRTSVARAAKHDGAEHRDDDRPTKQPEEIQVPVAVPS